MSDDSVQKWSPNQTLSVSLTPAAIAHVKKEISKQGHGIGIQFGVIKSGCSGFAYVVNIIDDVSPTCYAFEAAPGITVSVDKESLTYVQGTRIDYVREGLNSRFKFENPNESGSCGCGESFTIK